MLRLNSLFSKVCIIAVLIGASLFNWGCRSQSQSKIIIDTPEVFSRERLVRERLKEKNWLEKKLKQEDFQVSIQGYRDVRAFEGFVAQFRGSYDPLGGRLSTSGIESDIKRQAEIADLQHQLDVLKLQQQIDTLRAGNDKNDQEGSVEPGTTGTSTSAEDAGTSGSVPEGGDNYFTVENPYNSENLSSLPDPGTIVESRAQLTGIEKLRDEKAYRDTIQAMLRETVLDDAHDLYGKTIYTLKFDVTLLPGIKNNSYGTVELILKEKEPTEQEYEALFQRWREELDREIRLESLNLQYRYEKGYLTPQEKTDLIIYAVDHQLRADVFSELADNLSKNTKPETPVRPEINEALCRIFEERYVELKDDYITSYNPARVNVSDYNTYYISSIHIHPLNKNLTEYPDSKVDDFKDILTEFNNQFEKAGEKLSSWEPYIKLIKEKGDRIKYLKGIYGDGNYYVSKIEKDIERLEKDVEEWTSSVKELQELSRQEEKRTVELLKEEWRKRINESRLEIEMYKKDIRGDIKTLKNDLQILIIEKKISDKIYSEEEKRPIIYDYIRDNQFQYFVRTLRRLGKKGLPYVYTVDPKEYAQNISDVAAVEKLKNLVLSLKTILPQSGVEADGYINSIKRSQSLLHAIMRRPLVVGFINGKNRFGWVLGPRFKIGRGGKVDFDHTPVQHSLQASVVVPGWYNEIELQTGSSMSGILKTRDFSTIMEVKLPGDMSALTRGLLAFKGIHTYKPNIEVNPENPQIILHAEKKETILIRGKRLWRNPEVYIGTQKADDLEIMPDMGGLVATFDKVLMPTKIGSSDPKVDLIVITSAGLNKLQKAVTILPPQKQWDTASVRLVSTQSFKGGSLQLTVSSRLIPQSPDVRMFRLRLKPKGEGRWHLVGSSPSILKPGGNTIKLIFTDIQYQGDAKMMVADLQVLTGPPDTFTSIPSTGGVLGSFVYFEKKSDFNAHLVHKDKAIECSTGKEKDLSVNRILQDITLNINHPDLFFEAAPGLKTALDSKLKIHISTQKAGVTSSDILVLEKEKGQFKFDKGKETGTITILAGKLKSTEKDAVSAVDLIVEQVKAANGTKTFDLWLELPNGKRLDVEGKLRVRLKTK